MNLNLNFDGDTKLKDWWKTVKSNFQNIKSDFENEVTTRANADSELKNVINAETAARLKTDNELSSKINNEISSRKTADDELSLAISSEKKARISEDNNILNIISEMYYYENMVYISNLDMFADEYYVFPDYIPINTFFFIINDTNDVITEFRYSDMTSTSLSVPIPPDEIPRLCILTKRETAGVDVNEDGHIFVLDDTQVSLTIKAYAAPKRHRSSSDAYGMGSATYYGHVKLSNSTSSTRGESGGIAATPYAVKQAYDLANSANTRANDAYDLADDVYFSLYTNGYAGGSEVTADLSELYNASYSNGYAGAAEVVQAVSELSHPASGDEYFTGKWWLDGSPIYRRDFCIQVANTSEEWENKRVDWNSLDIDMDDFIVNSKAYCCAGWIGDTNYNINIVDVEPVETYSGGIRWTQDINSYITVLNIWGFAEYCKTDGGWVSLDNVTHKFE